MRSPRISFDVLVTNPADIVAGFEKAITPRTKVFHLRHVIFLTGQIMRVGAICRLPRARGIAAIVDGAHAFAHMPYSRSDFDYDYDGATLHKSLLAQVGAGFLYVKYGDHLRPVAADSRCLVTVGIEGVDPNKFTAYLWSQYRIFVPGITHQQVQGIRVTPNVYATLEEIDAFGDVMEDAAKKGVRG